MDLKVKRRNTFYKFGVALLTVLSAVLVTLLIPALDSGGMYFLFLTAIIFSALYGDTRAGVFAGALAFVINLFLLAYLGKSPQTFGDLLVLLAFGLAAGFTVFICHARAKSEAARLLAESRYRMIFENAITGIYETTVEGRYAAANPKLAAMFGYESPAQLIEQAVNLNDKFYVCANRREEFIRQFETEGSITGFESEIYRRDKQPIWITENSVAVRNADGKVTGFQGTTIEITDRKCAEAALQKAREELEEKVVARTFDLENANKILRDEITERERIENALRQSEEKFRALVEVSSEMIWEVDEKTNYTYVSPKSEEFNGYKPHEILGKKPFFLMPPEEAKRVAKIFKEIGQNLKTFYFLESVIVHKNAEVSISETSGVPFFDDAGNFRGYRGVARDITERRRTADALRKSEEKFRALVEVSSELIWEIDENSNYTYISPKVKEFIGYEAHELIGRKPFFLMPPEEAKRVAQIYKQYGVEQKSFVFLKIRYLHKNGEIIISESSGIPLFDDAGNFRGYRGVARDVTSRKRAEAALIEAELHLRSVVTAAPVILFALDRAGRFTLSEGKGLEILGLKSGEVIGKSVFELYADVPTIIGDVKRALSGESITNTVEIGDLCYESRYTPIFDDEGEVAGLIGVSIDITEVKRIDNELLASQKQLRALSAHLQSVREEERKTIARELHDELGQQLTALKIDLVRFGEKTTGVGRNLSASEIKNKIPAMLTIVDSALDTTRKIVAELRPGLLDELGLAAAMEWQTQEFQKRTGIRCELEIEFDEAAAYLNLKTTVFRLLQECLTNIARHSGASRAQITLRDEGHRIFFEVADNGRGMSEPEANKPQSFGILGMRERALLLGGTVEISRIETHGTRVSVSIPRPAPIS